MPKGNAILDEISDVLGMKKGGTVSEYLDDLILTGYVSRDYTWNIKTGAPSSLSHYRLKDNYLRFYLKVIEPNRHKILLDEPVKLTSWDTIMGLQFENLVLNNRKKLKEHLNINPENVIFDNPYFQKNTNSHKGCQIDYLIQTKYNSLFLCEVKFSKNKIGLEIIEEIQDKIERLSVSKEISIWPVLIHVNGVTKRCKKAVFSQISSISATFWNNKIQEEKKSGLGLGLTRTRRNQSCFCRDRDRAVPRPDFAIIMQLPL